MPSEPREPGIDHPDHGDIVEDTIDPIRRDWTKETLRCKRCNSHVPRGEPDRFDDIDCDESKQVSESIAGNLNGRKASDADE